MSRHKSSGRSGRRSNSSKQTGAGDDSRKSRPSRRPTSGKSFGAKKKEERPSDQRGKFRTERTNKPFDRSSSNSSSVENTNERKTQKPYPRNIRRNEKDPYKNEGNESPTRGLRRERPFKKSGDIDKSSSEKNYRAYSPKPQTNKRSKKFRVTTDKLQPDIAAPVQTGKIRLNKFIANSGVCSRREADELIKMGIIAVNGKVITELGYKVNPGDEVRHENKVLRAEKPVYILLNKPKGFLTTTNDPQERNTVMHLIGNIVKERVYPVGRLDRNTTGLLLLTNDGDLADKLMHPSYNVKKIYKVELDRPLTKADAQLILDGVQLEEGKAMVDDIAIVSDDKRMVGLEIHIGWNRVVRRIFESLNYDVVKLDRSVYAGLDKKNLGRGEWRFLTKEELVRLKHF